METASLTLVIPVYGESPYLGQALDSTLPFLASNTRLLIIDDGLSINALNLLKDWLDANRSELITYVQNPSNLGLFKSLNTNLSLVETEWICFLCSDDYLLSDAINKIQKLTTSGDEGLVLSRFQSVNSDSSDRYDDAKDLLKLISQHGFILTPEQMLLSLLRYGSLNGNLSGMMLRKSLWDHIGGFKEDWHHAADWDWLVNACKLCRTQVNDQYLVAIRTHKNQLSAHNQYNGSAMSEAVEVIKELRKHPHVQQHWLSLWWAGCLLQHHLWSLIFKRNWRKNDLQLKESLLLLNQAVPLWIIFIAMVCSLPKRLLRRSLMALTYLLSHTRFQKPF